jgi:Tfp pilus assembly protein PilO
MRQRLQPYLRYLVYILLAVLLGVVDVLLLAGASGALGTPPDPAVQAARVQQVTRRMDDSRKRIAEEKFPQTIKVENLILSLSDVADKMGVRISAFNGTRQSEKISDRAYVAIENALELRGGIDDLIAFLRHIQERSGIETLEMKNVGLRFEIGTWVLLVQIRMLTE